MAYVDKVLKEAGFLEPFDKVVSIFILPAVITEKIGEVTIKGYDAKGTKIGRGYSVFYDLSSREANTVTVEGLARFFDGFLKDSCTSNVTIQNIGDVYDKLPPDDYYDKVLFDLPTDKEPKAQAN